MQNPFDLFLSIKIIKLKIHSIDILGKINTTREILSKEREQ